MRQRRAPVPWFDMLRAAVAICVPLSVALAAGRGTLGVLPAMGGLLGTLADTGGPYLTRVKRVASACLLGGAAGLTIGGLIHGHGWVAVIALVLVAGVSALLSSFGELGSVAGLQLLVYTALGFGPVGAERPVWHTAGGFLLGAAWAVLLILPGWLWSPRSKEQRDVAQVYAALAGKLAAIGTSRFATARQDVTAALNTAYDELLTARSVASGRNRRTMRLIAVLNASHQIVEASTALGLSGDRPPPTVHRRGAADGFDGARREPAAVHPAILGWPARGRGRCGTRSPGRRGCCPARSAPGRRPRENLAGPGNRTSAGSAGSSPSG